MNLNPFSYKNPADSAMPYLQKVPGTVTPYYQPYVDAGSDALAQLLQQYSILINDPSQIMSKIGNSYTSSPGYNYNYNESMNAANNAEAAGGMLGTPSSQEQAAKIASNLASEDYNTYMKEGLGLYDEGLQGESGINTQGYNASSSLANILANNLMSEGTLAYKGTENNNANNSAMFKNIVSLLTSAFGGGTNGLLSEGADLLGGLMSFI